MKKTLPILVVGHMIASKAGLTPVVARLRARGHEVHAFLPGGKDFTPQDEAQINSLLESGISALVTGMASQEAIAGVELATVRRAKELGMPVCYYADTFDSWGRPWYAEFLPGGTLFVLDENEAGKAKGAFPDTTVVPSGNPEWNHHFFGEHPSREEVRSKLGLRADDLVIHVPWGKSATVNTLHLSGVFDAVRGFQFSQPIHIVVTPHGGGDQNPPAVYDDLWKFAPVPTSFVTKELLTSSEVLGGADLMVDSAGIGIHAICRGFPLIDFFSPLALDRLENSIKTRDWVPCAQGASMSCRTPTHLRELICGFLQRAPWVAMQQAKQKELYPKPEKEGEALRMMVEAIEAKLAS